MDFLKLIFSKLFFKHLAIAVIAGIVLFWIVLKSMDIYTRQGRSVEVPDFKGMTVDEVGRVENNDNYEIVVIDSMFEEDFPLGSIVLQDPPAGAKVKSGRKIYVTIVSTQPEMVRMPNLVDLSLRQALTEIESASLTLDHLEYTENFAKNAVLDQQVDGEEITPGTEILKGTSLTLILGKGLDNQKVSIPALIGKTEYEAISMIHNSSLNVGYIKFLDTHDPVHSLVYLQQPGANSNNQAELGTYINLWLRSDLFYDFDSLIQSNQTDSVLSDSLIINDELF